MSPRWPQTLFAGTVLLTAVLAHDSVHAGQKALLIGIGEYPHLPPKNQLSAPPNDVRAMRKFLIDEWGFSKTDIRALVDEDAAKSEILDALGNWLPGATRAGDRVVIYYSGHGSKIPDDNGDESDGKDETFVPSDYGRNGKRNSDMLRDDEVADALKRISDRRVVFIADSCHSGTVTRSLESVSFSPFETAKPRYLPQDLPRAATRSIGIVRDEEPISQDIDDHVHLTLSAALPYQLAWEENGSGIFTSYLIEALTDLQADQNGNGRVTSAELINYIKPKTEAWCEKVPKCLRYRGFTPNMDPKNGSIVLQPAPDSEDLPVLNEGDPDAISDILPEFASNLVKVEIFPGHRIRKKENISFRLTSSVDGYVTLLDLNADGEMVLLFPSEKDIKNRKSGRIRMGAPLTVPDKSYKFIAGDPTGRGRLMVIVTEDFVEFDRLLKGHRDLEPIKDKLEFVSSIAERLHTVWTGDPENRGARWAIGYIDYVIYE